MQFHPEVVPEIVREWALDYESDPDAIAMGFDPPAHIAEAAERLPAWMEIGRDAVRGLPHSSVCCASGSAGGGGSISSAPPPPRG